MRSVLEKKIQKLILFGAPSFDQTSASKQKSLAITVQGNAFRIYHLP
jgi:hypothetical protein